MKKQKITFTWLTPANIVTYLGMILVIVSYYCFISAKDNVSGAIFFIIAALTDWLDGFVAKNGKIQKFFRGRGVSKQGKMLDPLRDTMLRASIFILAIISSVSLWFPTIVALITLLTLIMFNRPINNFSGEVVVTKTGKKMQATDCTALIIWILIIALNPMTDVWNWSGTIILITMITTAVIRYFSYFSKYLEIEEKTRERS